MLDLTRVSVTDLDLASAQMMRTALCIRPGERVCIVADAGSVRMADSLERAARDCGSEATTAWIERGATLERLTSLLERAQASAFVANARPEELPMRQAVLRVVRARGIRHAHLPGISHLAFVRGLRVDYDVVAGHGMRVLTRLANARRIVTSAESGSLLLVRGEPDIAWFAQLGRLEPGRWGNLPAGALYATPRSVEGTFVADAAVGGGFGASYGAPITVHIREARVTAVEVPGDAALERAFEKHLRSVPNADRVGLVALGVNYGIEEATGEPLVDQNLPGLHLALGDPAAGVTGADFRAATSIALCQARSAVWIDGECVVRDGRLVAPS